MQEIVSFDQLDLSKQYTYADYLKWKFKERVELIKGWVVKMSPAPNRKHQEVSFRISNLIFNILQNKECRAYTAPFDVVLTKNNQNTVVQPDICVICDRSKLTEQGCTGSPDLVIEILSPGNSQREMKEKFELYEENEIQEYWMISPIEESITVYSLNEQGKYMGSKPFILDEIVATTVLQGFDAQVASIFKD